MNALLKIGCALLLFMNAAAAHALSVVTTTRDLAALAHAVAGEQVQVQSLTPGTRDPHFAAAKPSMIRTVHDADLLLVVGAELEAGWLPPLLQAARNARVQPGRPGYLDLSESVVLLGKADGPVSRAMGDVHAAGNPHYWLDPRNGVRMAEAIATRLGELDPANREHYQQRYEAFAQAMVDRITAWRSALSALEGRPVLAYHRSFVYLADAFGFRIVDEVEPRPGIAPSAASLAALVKRIREQRIELLIMEPYYERRSANYLQEQTGIRLAVLPQSVGALPGVETYIGLFEAIVAALRDAGAQ